MYFRATKCNCKVLENMYVITILNLLSKTEKLNYEKLILFCEFL